MMASGSGVLMALAFIFLLAVVLGVIGIFIAATNIWAFFIQWLSLLGIIVPPIGAIIIDQYLKFKYPNSYVDADWCRLAFIAWTAGSVVAFIIENSVPRAFNRHFLRTRRRFGVLGFDEFRYQQKAVF